MMGAMKGMRGWALFSGAAIRCEDVPAESDDAAPVWVQIATEGTYKGHPRGPFDLKKADLEQVVTNFQRHPDYHCGPNGVGDARVIAFDFHHASEQDPGRVAVNGAPAQAWALDLAVRDGENGKAQLWALTEYLEPMRTYAKEGRYKSTSVSLWPDAVDPVTAETIGWYLSSIAFTNDPFIQGMIPIAAARGCDPSTLRARLMTMAAASDAGAPRTLSYGWFERAGSGLEAVEAMRRLFAIPATGDLAAELGKLAAFAAGGTAPVGVEVDELVECLRTILGLPVLTDAGAVVQEALRVAGGIAAARTNEAGQGERPHAPSGSSREVASTLTRQGPRTMDQLLKILAERFGISTNDADVQTRVLAALDAGSDAKATLDKVLALLGSADLDGAKAKVSEFKQAVADLERVLPELKSMGDESMAAEEAAAETDVAEVMTTTRVPDTMRDALMLERTGGIKITDPLQVSKVLAARRELRAAFQAKHLAADKTKTAPAPAYLTRPIATTPAGQVHSPVLRALSAASFVPGAAPVTQEAPIGSGAAGLMAEIEAAAGRNITEKAISLVRSRPGGAALSFDAAHAQASALVQQAKQVRA